MEAPKTLRRPANWQDFESLCKKLWGEIWACPEIQKNGRLGQEQFGVDVFGIPFEEDGYYGIQCKGKSEYNDNQFTTSEIDKEIEKAKTFEPPLKKLYFATTALNDSKIQTYVRKKNLEHINSDLFEIHLFCWETIADLIDENKQTHDWYVKSLNYKSNKNVSITFQDGSKTLTINPKFQQTNIDYLQKIIPKNMMQSASFDSFGRQIVRAEIITSSFFDIKVNLSYSKVNLRIHNTGTDPIEEYKVLLQFEGDIQDLKDDNEEGNNIAKLVSKHIIPNTFLWSESMTGKINPRGKMLVGDDAIVSEDIYVKPLQKGKEIIIKWKLISKDFKDEGDLILNVEPDIEIKNKTILVSDPFKVRFEEGEVKDCIVEKDSK